MCWQVHATHLLVSVSHSQGDPDAGQLGFYSCMNDEIPGLVCGGVCDLFFSWVSRGCCPKRDATAAGFGVAAHNEAVRFYRCRRASRNYSCATSAMIKAPPDTMLVMATAKSSSRMLFGLQALCG
jgi:hypothetical protein